MQRTFGSARDGDRIRAICEWHAKVEPDLLPAMLETFPAIRPALRLLPFKLLLFVAVGGWGLLAEALVSSYR